MYEKKSRTFFVKKKNETRSLSTLISPNPQKKIHTFPKKIISFYMGGAMSGAPTDFLNRIFFYIYPVQKKV